MDTSSMDQEPLDVDLDCKLKIVDSHELEDQPEQPTRTLRRRLPPKQIDKTQNRRVQMKPTKRKNFDVENTCKVAIKRTNSLETIFEEPKNGNKTQQNNTLIGGRKLIRAINFSVGGQYTSDKIKKRRKRIKRFLGKSVKNMSKKLDMATFLKNLKEMTDDDDIPHRLDPL